jgi:MFS transporter, YQGE family, putative transporter
MNNTVFRNLIWMYSSYVLFTTISRSVLPTHIFQQGLSLNQMMLGHVILFAAQLLLLTFLTKYSAKKSWFIATISAALSVALVININSVPQYFLSVIFSGLTLGFFFIMYNIAHFQNTPKEKTGLSSGIMYAVGPVIAIVVPIISGLVATYNINWLWVISFIAFLMVIYTVTKQAEFHITYNVLQSLRELKATRIYIFLEGIWEAVIISIIPIYTLKFISTPLEYGKYIAYLSLAGLIASLTLGKLSDKLQKRSFTLYPITITLSLLTIILSFSMTNIYLWIVTTGLIQFLIPVFWNMTTALVVDKHSNLKLAIPGREILLASGRIIGLAVAFWGFQYNHVQIAFILLAGVMLLFPAVLYWNTSISKKYSYL